MINDVQGWGLIGLIRSISKVWGKGTYTKLTNQMNENLRESYKHQFQASSSYPVSLADELVAQVERTFGDGSGVAARKLGHAVGVLAIEVVFTVYRSVGSLERAVGSLPRAWQKVYPRLGSQEPVVSTSPTQGTFLVEDFLELSELWRPYWEGWIQGYVESALGDKETVAVSSKKTAAGVEFLISK